MLRSALELQIHIINPTSENLEITISQVLRFFCISDYLPLHLGSGYFAIDGNLPLESTLP